MDLARSLHTHFNENKGNIELLLRTVISVNQLSIYRAVTDLCKELNKNSAEYSAEDSSEDSESSNLQCLKNARLSLGGNATISETDTSRTSTTSTTRSATRRRKKTSITMSIGKLDGGTTESHGETGRQRLHLEHRSGKPHTGKQVGARGSPHHLINGGDFSFLEGIPKNRRGV